MASRWWLWNCTLLLKGDIFHCYSCVDITYFCIMYISNEDTKTSILIFSVSVSKCIIVCSDQTHRKYLCSLNHVSKWSGWTQNKVISQWSVCTTGTKGHWYKIIMLPCKKTEFMLRQDCQTTSKLLLKCLLSAWHVWQGKIICIAQFRHKATQGALQEHTNKIKRH